MTSSLFKRTKALMETDPQKYNAETAQSYLKAHEQHGVDFLSMAVLVNDAKEPVTIPDLEIGDGTLAVPDDKFIREIRPTLTTEQLASVQYGGAGNVALPAAALGIKTGVIGYVGKDIEGGFFIGGMRANSINTLGIIIDERFRTDLAFAPMDETGRRAPIAFCEDAGKYLDPNDKRVKERLLFLNPQIVQVSYSGLFERGGDLEGGKRLASGISWMKKNLETLVMLDTHTYTTDPKRYDCLKPSLQVADMFVCSNDEVNLIVPQFRIQAGPTEEERKKAFLAFIEENYCKGTEARLYAVTSPEKTTVLYYKPNDKSVQLAVGNWFFTTKEHIFDTTGAGDSWRAGLNAYILHHLNEYKTGTLNIEEAVQCANLTARLYISGKGTSAFKNYKYQDIMNLVSKPKPETDLSCLTRVYDALDRAA